MIHICLFLGVTNSVHQCGGWIRQERWIPFWWTLLEPSASTSKLHLHLKCMISTLIKDWSCIECHTTWYILHKQNMWLNLDTNLIASMTPHSWSMYAANDKTNIAITYLAISLLKKLYWMLYITTCYVLSYTGATTYNSAFNMINLYFPQTRLSSNKAIQALKEATEH